MMVSMNKLSTERRAQILGMMVEGNSIRAIVRMTGASRNTIVKLLGACLGNSKKRSGQGAGSSIRWTV
jgi:hypothetical protein